MSADDELRSLLLLMRSVATHVQSAQFALEPSQVRALLAHIDGLQARHDLLETMFAFANDEMRMADSRLRAAERLLLPLAGEEVRDKDKRLTGYRFRTGAALVWGSPLQTQIATFCFVQEQPRPPTGK